MYIQLVHSRLCVFISSKILVIITVCCTNACWNAIVLACNAAVLCAIAVVFCACVFAASAITFERLLRSNRCRFRADDDCGACGGRADESDDDDDDTDECDNNDDCGDDGCDAGNSERSRMLELDDAACC